MRLSGAQLLVGKAARALPPEVIPPDARVLGSFDYDRMSTTVFAMATGSQQARAQFNSRLEKAGWTRPPAPRRSMRPTKGFIDQQSMGFDTPEGWCRDDRSLTADFAPRGPGSVIVSVYHSRGGYSGQCKAERAFSGMSLEDLPIPSLSPPEGLLSEGRGFSGGSSDWTLHATLRGQGSLDTILRHYVEQMVAARWTEGERATVSMAGLQLLRLADADGTTWHAIFSVTSREPERAFDVSLNLRRR